MQATVGRIFKSMAHFYRHVLHEPPDNCHWEDSKNWWHLSWVWGAWEIRHLALLSLLGVSGPERIPARML